jgi:UDP-GlcNAc:undecaprenyl-phosphate/decaprenyl-phosphate GlcNAc-1-phosphate transferase
MEISSLLIIFSILTLASGLLNFLLLRWTKTLGTKDQANSNQERWSVSHKPAIGGISFFIVFLISYLIYLFQTNPDLSELEETTHLGILIAVTIGFFAGLADDAFNTIPWLKLFAQLICGSILIYFNVQIQFFQNPILDGLLTLFWVVAVMNSLNMLDNMDAITGIVSISILLSTAIFSLPITDANLYFTFICGGTLSAIVGFMFFNWNPSKIFMGDTGSQMLGALLAAIGIVFFWNNETTIENHAWFSKISIVAAAFVVPIADSLTVTVNRLRRGQSPFVGGRDHTTHHLSYAGLNDRKVAFVFIGISVISILLLAGFQLSVFESWNWCPLILMGFSIATISFLYSTTLWKKPRAIFESSLAKSSQDK